jgi:hypothetical protein
MHGDFGVNMHRMTSGASDRRGVIKAGAGTLAALAGLGAVSMVRAQDGTPEAGTPEAVGGRDLNGFYGVTRTYTVKDDADVDELNAIVEGFVAIVSATPGFINYTIIYDDSTRTYQSIGLFESVESSEASNAAAADFRAENNLADFFVDPEPIIVEGEIVINAGH